MNSSVFKHTTAPPASPHVTASNSSVARADGSSTSEAAAKYARRAL